MDDYSEQNTKQRHDKYMSELQSIRNEINTRLMNDGMWNWVPKDENEERQQRSQIARELYAIRDRLNTVLGWLGID